MFGNEWIARIVRAGGMSKSNRWTVSEGRIDGQPHQRGGVVAPLVGRDFEDGAAQPRDVEERLEHRVQVARMYIYNMYIYNMYIYNMYIYI